ncbi:MAG: Uridine kinase [bacterium]|nr:Uridine kinase [bacterium]
MIGIAGGSGSGKTMVTQKIVGQLGSDRVIIIEQDSYYRNLNHLSIEERATYNFDHPSSIDSELLIRHIKELLSGHSIDIPIYDFTTHTRRPETRRTGPHDVIVLEGILILDNPALRELMDIKVYVDTDADLRFIRRLKRDTTERGRTVQSVIEQYEKSVRPMHLQFVEPSKRYADLIIPEGGYNLVAIDLLRTKIAALLKERQS